MYTGPTKAQFGKKRRRNKDKKEKLQKFKNKKHYFVRRGDGGNCQKATFLLLI